MLTVKLQLLSSSGHSFAGHRVNIRFEKQVLAPSAESPELWGEDEEARQTFWVTDETTAPLSASGSATLELPDKKSMRGMIEFSAAAPDGETLARHSIAVDALEPELTFEIDPKPPIVLRPSDDPAFGRPTRLRGRVIDPAGRPKIGRLPVRLWARANAEEEFRVVSLATTDNAGYFSTDYPLGKYSEAYGEVGVAGRPTSPIRLNDGLFPTQLILVVELPEQPDSAEAEPEDPCACADDLPRLPDSIDLAQKDGTFSQDLGGGRCANLFPPNRVLEEFTYYAVVRTSEPVIQGTTLWDTPVEQLASVHNALASTLHSLALTAGRAEEERETDETAPGVFNLLNNVAPELLKNKNLAQVLKAAKLEQFIGLLHRLAKRPPGRDFLNAKNPVDWDREPTFYQATTIAHGHILRYKQSWRSDGYSLGDLAYSLPLAPCQKKQIAIVDWDRREDTIDQQDLSSVDWLAADLAHDRDILEIQKALLSETMNAHSYSKVSSWSAGFIFAGGGSSTSTSSAHQDSARLLAASAAQQLRDRTSQTASSIRNFRSTTVKAVQQRETVRVETETVANHNHCHAITIQYFEVLRHLLVEHELAEVQECLFVPLLMSTFDEPKVLRWRSILEKHIRRRALRPGFDASARRQHNYAGSNLPESRFAAEPIKHLEGHLELNFHIARPRDTETDQFDMEGWKWAEYIAGFGSAEENYKKFLQDQQDKDVMFHEHIAPIVAERFVQALQFSAVLTSSQGDIPLPIDATLVDRYRPGRTLRIALHPRHTQPAIKREDIAYIRIHVKLDPNDPPPSIVVPRPDLISELTLKDVLPANSKIIVTSGRMTYRTERHSQSMFSRRYLRNDLSGTDDVLISTPLHGRELSNPRLADEEAANQLLTHLNEHLEYYHKLIWWLMEASRPICCSMDLSHPTAAAAASPPSSKIASLESSETRWCCQFHLAFDSIPGSHASWRIRSTCLSTTNPKPRPNRYG